MARHKVPEDLTPAHPVEIPDHAVRAKWMELLGLEEVPAGVDFTVDSEQETAEGIRASRLRFTNVLGETVPGILCTPATEDEGPRPAVVCMPGTSGTAERVADERFHRPSPDKGPLVGWGRELARRGFVTLSITLKGTCERRLSEAHWECEAKLLAAYGRTQMGIAVNEALRAARVLAGCEGVDPGRVGLAGMSLGGYAAWWSMACVDWIRTAVPICGGAGSLARAIHEGDPERHSSCFYVPHVLRFFDFPRIVRTCIAPRPFMTVAPLRDEDMPGSGVDELLREVTPAYESAGAAEMFKVYRPDTNHVFLIPYFEWMVDWFKQHL